MEAFRPITSRDLEILGLPPGYDAIQITLSRIAYRNEIAERDTYRTGHMPIEEYLAYDPSKVIHEPELTRVLTEMDRRGQDPMQFIRFIGGVAVRI